MKDIEELIQNVEKYRNTVVQKKFVSKKNTVAYTIFDNKPRVIKWYAPAFTRQMEIEYSVLKKGSSKLNIPLALEKDTKNNVLIMSYISGKNLCDVMNDDSVTSKEKTRITESLADWFVQFHTFFKKRDQLYTRGDPVLRNYIINNRIWGVDFEEFRIGKPVEDIAGMCSSILSTDPLFTNEKFQICETFIERYRESVKWSLENINEEIAYALLQKVQWRPKEEETLRKYAKRIKKRGLR